MATYTQMITSVQQRCANHTSLTSSIAGSLINEAHADLVESHEWSRRRDEIFILTTAEESSGTFSVTNGSSTAAGTGVSLSSADEGKYIRFGTDDALYVVGTVAGDNFTIFDFNGSTVTYAGTTDTAATYVMFERWYNLGTGIEAIDLASYKDKLYEVTTDWLDHRDPLRTTTGDPLRFARGPRDSSDLVQVEFWPRPTGTITVRFNVELGHTDLSGSNRPIVPTPVVVVKAAILSLYFLFSKDKDDRWLQLAAKYDKEFDRIFELHKRLDEAKFGMPHHLQDVGDTGLQGTDYYVDKDDGF